LKKLILILGDQLDVESAALKDINPKTDEVLMVESANEAQHVWSHKARIALFLSAMRHFAEHLKAQGFLLSYIERSPKSIVEELKSKIVGGKFTHLICVEPGEWRSRDATRHPFLLHPSRI
jgi:deoxyribodipyrimidine photolyase-related protein